MEDRIEETWEPPNSYSLSVVAKKQNKTKQNKKQQLVLHTYK